MDLPTIQTNIWDAVLGVLISIFYSHRHDLPAGLFMGFFYGNAAVGTYSGMKTALTAYRRSDATSE